MLSRVSSSRQRFPTRAPPLAGSIANNRRFTIAGSLVYVTGSLLLFHPAAHACQCTAPQADLLGSDAVFVGTLEETVIENPVATDETDDRLVATLYVQRIWKGVTLSPQIVATSVQDCGIPFIAGQAYLIFARQDATGRLLTGRCDGTQLVQDSSVELEKLGAAKTWPPVPLSQLNAIRMAIRFWQARYGHEVEPLSIDNPPHVDDLGYAWRVWVLTPYHQFRPLEVNIDKATHELTEMQDSVKGSMRER